MLPIVTPNILTLEEFTIKEMRSFPRATGQLAGLLRDIGLAAKRINTGVSRAGLVDIFGNTGTGTYSIPFLPVIYSSLKL